MTNKQSGPKALLMNVSGPDRPGITAKLMELIAKAEHNLLDIGQSVTNGLLSLSMLIDSDELDGPMVKDLLFISKSLGLTLDFQMVDQAKLEGSYVSYVLSCVGKDQISAAFIYELSSMLAHQKVNIKRIHKVGQHTSCLEMRAQVPKELETGPLKNALLEISTKHSVDIAFLKETLYRRSKRLIAFDMDSTLIQGEVIDELARRHGVFDQVAKITHQAMNGDIDFLTSLKERVALLEGLSTDCFQSIATSLPLTPGVEQFVSQAKDYGFKIAVISGGFDFFTGHIKEHLKLDYAFANKLQVKAKKLTGRLEGPIMTPEQKATVLELIAQQEGVAMEQVVAVGDGANDLLMLDKAGLGIAFHGKDAVVEQAEHNLSHGTMKSLLYFLGLVESLNEF